MNYKAYSSIREIASEWDEFLPPNHNLRSSNLSVPELSELSDISFTYILIRNEKEELVAIIYLQNIHFQKKHYISPFKESIVLSVIENLITAKGFQLIVCGNLFRIDSSGIYYNPKKTNASYVFTVLEHYLKNKKKKYHVLLVKDWHFENGINWVEELGYQRWEGDLTMKFNVDKRWEAFEDYIKSQKHKYAQRTRKSRKLLGQVKRKLIENDSLDAYFYQLEELYNNVVQKQVIRMVLVNKKYFKNMKESLGDNFRIHGYFLEDELIGFSSQIVYPNELESHFIGINYNYNTKHWLYFNILFDTISDAIELKKQSIEFGRTARVAKKNIGAYPTYFDHYYKIRGKISSELIRLLNNSFNKMKAKTTYAGKKEES